MKDKIIFSIDDFNEDRFFKNNPFSDSLIVPITSLSNQKHLYFLNLEYNFFNGDHPFENISKKVKDDIRHNICKLVINQSDGINQLSLIELWRKNEKFPENTIYYITSDLIVNKLKNKTIKTLGVSICEKFIYNQHQSIINNKEIINFSPIDNKYLFLSFNRKPREHRIFFVHECIKNDLFNIGIISLPKIFWNDNFSNKYYDINILQKMIKTTPYYIDSNFNFKNASFKEQMEIKLTFYEKTFISVINETFVNSGSLFITEKTWKSISIGHPFIIYSNPHILKELKSMGYKTFDKWIDESYDKEFDEFKRGNMIIYELIKLKKYH
jgi:hypothetical protein